MRGREEVRMQIMGTGNPAMEWDDAMKWGGMLESPCLTGLLSKHYECAPESNNACRRHND